MLIFFTYLFIHILKFYCGHTWSVLRKAYLNKNSTLKLLVAYSTKLFRNVKNWKFTAELLHFELLQFIYSSSSSSLASSLTLFLAEVPMFYFLFESGLHSSSSWWKGELLQLMGPVQFFTIVSNFWKERKANIILEIHLKVTLRLFTLTIWLLTQALCRLYSSLNSSSLYTLLISMSGVQSSSVTSGLATNQPHLGVRHVAGRKETTWKEYVGCKENAPDAPNEPPGTPGLCLFKFAENQDQIEIPVEWKSGNFLLFLP